MKLNKDFLRCNDLGLLVLRLTMGGLMLFHGVHKLTHGVGFIGDMLAGMGLPSFIAYGALLGEVVVEPDADSALRRIIVVPRGAFVIEQYRTFQRDEYGE